MGRSFSRRGKTRVSIYLDDDLLKNLRERADAAGRGYQAMISEALREYLARSERRPLARHVEVTADELQIDLADGRRLSVPPEQLQSLAAKQTEKQLLAQAATGDYSWGGASQVAGFDSKAAWRWNSQQHKVMKRNRPTGDEAPGFGLDGGLMDYRDRGYRAELAGRAKAEGKDCG